MTTAVVERPMAKKKPTNAKPSTSVKIHDDVLDVARIVASYHKDMTITDLLSDILKPTLDRMHQEAMAKFNKTSTKT